MGEALPQHCHAAPNLLRPARSRAFPVGEGLVARLGSLFTFVASIRCLKYMGHPGHPSHHALLPHKMLWVLHQRCDGSMAQPPGRGHMKEGWVQGVAKCWHPRLDGSVLEVWGASEALPSPAKHWWCWGRCPLFPYHSSE